jgi:hypothetical protein
MEIDDTVGSDIAVTEAAVQVLGKGRVIRHSTVEAEPAEPKIGGIQVHFLAQRNLWDCAPRSKH